jgi:hypothetical protein
VHLVTEDMLPVVLDAPEIRGLFTPRNSFPREDLAVDIYIGSMVHSSSRMGEQVFEFGSSGRGIKIMLLMA